MITSINPLVFDFLTSLQTHNNREWFNANKADYALSLDYVSQFADTLLSELRKGDNIETPSGKKSLYRIYRDTRFSKNKTPYKTHWGGSFSRATHLLRGGYYFHIEPGNCFVGGGFWQPNSDDLKRIRKRIALDDSELREIISSKKFVSTFGELVGDRVKTAPQGFKKDHPAIDLLRYKQFLVMKKFSDTEALHSNYAKKVIESFHAMRPFFDYMSEILTTDVNGTPLIT